MVMYMRFNATLSYEEKHDLLRLLLVSETSAAAALLPSHSVNSIPSAYLVANANAREPRWVDTIRLQPVTQWC